MKIPYAENETGVFSPLVRLEINCKQQALETEAYVDSGASYSIFKAEIAEMLGLNFKKGHRVLLTVGDGGLIPVYLHNLDVCFAGHKFVASLSFSDKLGIDFNLLGRASFFKKFMFCFNDKDNCLSVSWLGK